MAPRIQTPASGQRGTSGQKASTTTSGQRATKTTSAQKATVVGSQGTSHLHNTSLHPRWHHHHYYHHYVALYGVASASDAQLREALALLQSALTPQNLQQAQSLVVTTPGEYGGHRLAAAGEIESAMTQYSVNAEQTTAHVSQARTELQLALGMGHYWSGVLLVAVHHPPLSPPSHRHYD